MKRIKRLQKDRNQPRLLFASRKVAEKLNASEIQLYQVAAGESEISHTLILKKKCFILSFS